jgi:hypothetical protein
MHHHLDGNWCTWHRPAVCRRWGGSVLHRPVVCRGWGGSVLWNASVLVGGDCVATLQYNS